ncbi:MAG: hypothetical protein VXW87_01620 [Pseudomonadota bacterium]|nr:hypothetical protein [Pseudomonadota bacterium]
MPLASDTLGPDEQSTTVKIILADMAVKKDFDISLEESLLSVLRIETSIVYFISSYRDGEVQIESKTKEQDSLPMRIHYGICWLIIKLRQLIPSIECMPDGDFRINDRGLYKFNRVKIVGEGVNSLIDLLRAPTEPLLKVNCSGSDRYTASELFQIHKLSRSYHQSRQQLKPEVLKNIQEEAEFTP